MRGMPTFRLWSIVMALCLLCLVATPTALADAAADISIAARGACATGGTAFFITNNNANSGISATLTQTSSVSSPPTSSTVQVSLGAGEQKLLGCSPQDSGGNYQITWQVQSAQYQ
jgi:hypothetical protein